MDEARLGRDRGVGLCYETVNIIGGDDDANAVDSHLREPPFLQFESCSEWSRSWIHASLVPARRFLSWQGRSPKSGFRFLKELLDGRCERPPRVEATHVKRFTKPKYFIARYR